MHYKNGTHAKVGDQVVGKVYNTDGIVAGTLVSITPGVDSCNCLVRFITALPYFAIEAEGESRIPRMAIPPMSCTLVKSEVHGTEGPEFAIYECQDYSACSELLRADEAFGIIADPSPPPPTP